MMMMMSRFPRKGDRVEVPAEPEMKRKRTIFDDDGEVMEVTEEVVDKKNDFCT